jgi:hypothetical protein
MLVTTIKVQQSISSHLKNPVQQSNPEKDTKIALVCKTLFSNGGQWSQTDEQSLNSGTRRQKVMARCNRDIDKKNNRIPGEEQV